MAGILLALWVRQVGAQNPKTWPMSFPEHSRATSPNRDYALVNVDRETEPYHTVLLENRKLKTRRELFHYGGGIDVRWNPDSQSFTLTDHAGSDYSLCSIVYVDKKCLRSTFGPIFGNASRRGNEDSWKAIITSTLRR